MRNTSTRFPFLPQIRRTKFKYDQLDFSAHERPNSRAPQNAFSPSSIWEIFRPASDKAAHICRTTGDVDKLKVLIRRSQLLGTWKSTSTLSGDAPIHEAAYSGFLHIVIFLVEEVGENIDAVTPGGHTPLCLACMEGHVEIAKYLLAAGASVKLTTLDGASVLHWACYCGREECVRYILAWASREDPYPQELSSTVRTAGGFTPLLLAACTGHEGVVRLMIEEFLVDVNHANDDGDTALHYACFEGHRALVKLLVADIGANTSLKDKAGYTPLHLAAARGHHRVLRLLLDDCTDVSTRHMLMCCTVVRGSPSPLPDSYSGCLLSQDSTGCIPLHLACQGGHVDAARILLGLPVKCSPNTLVADRTNESDMAIGGIGLDLREGDDSRRSSKYDNEVELPGHNYIHAMTTVVDKDGNNCLHTAVGSNKVRVASMLLGDCNMDVNCRNAMGYTPLLLAAWKGYYEMAVKLIQSFGADKFAYTEQGEYGLHLACLGGHERLVQYFVRADLDCHKLTAYGKSPLYLACQYGHTSIVHYLLQYGDGVIREQTDHVEGRTPLMVAAAYDQVHLVRYLVEKTLVNIVGVDKKGRTCLHWAARNGHAVITLYLLEAAERQKRAAALLWQRDEDGHAAADLSTSGEVDYLLAEKAVQYPSCDMETSNLMHIKTLGNMTDY